MNHIIGSHPYPRMIALLILFILTFLTACTNAAEPTPIPTPSSIPTKQNPTITTSPQPSVTPTPFPRPTNTPTSSPSPTPTAFRIPDPLPTLNATVQEKAQELMQTNGGCELPCWWGMIPGETSWDDVEGFLQTFALVYPSPYNTDDTHASYSVWYQLPDKDLHEKMGISVTGGVIDGIEASVNNFDAPPLQPDYYHIAQLLDALGPPKEIYYFHAWLGEVGQAYLDLILFYPNKGVLAEYIIYSEFDNNIFTSCPKGVGPEHLTLWQPQDEITTIFDVLPTDYFDFVGGPQILEATGMSIDSFYNNFKILEDNACLEIPES